MLNDLRIDVNFTEAAFLVKQFDLNKTGTMDFEDFAFFFNSCRDKYEIQEVVDRYRSSPPGTVMWKVLKECGDTEDTIGLSGCKEVDKLMHLEFRDEAELEDLFKLLDVDRSGQLEAYEFAEFFRRANNRKKLRGSISETKSSAKFLKKLYEEFDSSQCGEMEEADLCAVLRFCQVKADTKSVAAMMRDIDTNYDGKVSLHEFLKFFVAVRNITDLVFFMEQTQGRRRNKSLMSYLCTFLASCVFAFLMLLIYTPGDEITFQGFSFDRRFVTEEVKTALIALAGILLVAIFLCAGFGPLVWLFVNVCMPLGGILRLFLLKGAWFMLIVTLLLFLGNLLMDFQNPTLLIALVVSAGVTAFCFLALGCSLLAKRCWWFNAAPSDDADLEVKEEVTTSKKKKKKNILFRIWRWCTGKSAYEDMIRKIKKRSTETHIDTVVAWTPEPAVEIQEVNQTADPDRRKRHQKGADNV
jgi:Ca2+-binding EF-hand superfamily protein